MNNQEINIQESVKWQIRFVTTNRFLITNDYPRSFYCHGDFTIKEAQLLESDSSGFNELDLANREPQMNSILF